MIFTMVVLQWFDSLTLAAIGLLEDEWVKPLKMGDFQARTVHLPESNHHFSPMIWGFPSMGVPLNHPFWVGFSLINHPAIGIPPWRAGNLQKKWAAPGSFRSWAVCKWLSSCSSGSVWTRWDWEVAGETWEIFSMGMMEWLMITSNA